jgi:glutamate 5-kinase
VPETLTHHAPATARRPDTVVTGERVVLKIGTSSLVTAGRVDPVKLDRLCDSVHRGILRGLRPVLLASGAIAIGRTRHPRLAENDPAAAQVAFALGQASLYSVIQAAFADRGLRTGQVLLTPPELLDSKVGLTLATMLDLGMIPVVNENDALGVRNNDVLAALVAGQLQAGLLLLLTDVPGLHDGDPTRHIDEVRALTPAIEALAGDTGSGSGGMRTKLGACWIAMYGGVRAVIADGGDPDILTGAHDGTAMGTVFHPRAVTGATPPLDTLWRVFRAPPRGTLRCTPAGTALVAHGGALSREHATGDVEPGDVVDIQDAEGRTVARGVVAPGRRPIVAAGDYVRIVEEQS